MHQVFEVKDQDGSESLISGRYLLELMRLVSYAISGLLRRVGLVSNLVLVNASYV